MPLALIVGLLYGVFAAALFAIVAWRADRQYRRLAVIPSETLIDPAPTVAVIVPARNESANIGRVAASLIALAYPHVQVTVIDDHSSDDTADRARATGADVLRLDREPPPGWTGKCHACDQGALASDPHSVWLLFTDADTFHDPDSLRRAIAYAEFNKLDALSLLLRQECVGLWDRAILPLAYQQYFAAFRADHPVFNGQYILIRREIYFKSGGFGAVRGKVMEDVAFAESLHAQGYRIALANGESLVGVRMYADRAALWRGMTKTAFTAARDQGATGWLLGGLTFLGVGLLIGTIAAIISGAWPIALIGAAVWLFNALLLTPWQRRFAVHPAFGYALWNIPALGMLWLIGMVSTFRALFGWGVRWKGRTIIETRMSNSP